MKLSPFHFFNVEPPVWAEMGSAYASFGWGKVTQMYDSTGSARDSDGSLSVLNARIGGRYNIVNLPVQKIFVGGGLILHQRTLSVTLFESSSFELSSGFALQNISLYGGLEGPMYWAKGGFMLDLGPDAIVLNSDRQNALFLKAGLNVPIPSVSLGAFAHYYFTLQKDNSDYGDWIILGGRGGYSLPMGEAGLEARYILIIDNSSAYVLTLAPYLKVSLPAMPLSFMFKLAAYDEYTDYGISLIGKNIYVTRLGFTLGASARF